MKTHILVSLLTGAAIGFLVTFFTMRGEDYSLHAVAKNPSSAPDNARGQGSTDPFASGNEKSSPDDSEGGHLTKMDMSDPRQRDMCISYWYMGMFSVVEALETQTGHKFMPVHKLSAGPVEILEEQAAFMKTFLAETEKLYPPE